MNKNKYYRGRINHSVAPIAALWMLIAIAPPPANAQVYPSDGLIGFWSGNHTAADTSPVGNGGSFGGNYVTDPSGLTAFDLNTGKVVISDNPAYDFTSYDGWSVGFWFNPNGHSIHDAVFLGQDNGSGFRPKWFVDYSYTVFGENDRFNFHVNDFNRERIFLGSDHEPNVDLNAWHQLTVTIDNRDSGRVDFYLDGDPIGEGFLGNYVLQPTAPLVFGIEEGLNYGGWMRDVFLYDRVLTAEEAEQAGQPVPEISSVGAVAFGIVCAASLMRRRAPHRT